MTRLEWWLGVALVTGALVLHGALPRYEWHETAGVGYVAFDRWTGHARIARYQMP